APILSQSWHYNIYFLSERPFNFSNYIGRHTIHAVYISGVPPMPHLSPAATLSERVGQFASKFALSQVSKEGVLRAKLSILDSTGVALAATRHDFAHKTLTGLSNMGDRGTAPAIGMPTSLTVRDSMLMNGALIHGVDFDDSHQ